jgi:DNA-binding HxlR family transcriptional regulator
MSFPIPGKPVRGSKTGVPIMALFDLLGRNWAMGVIWQLQNGPYVFRELQQKCESISPSILNSRIKELKNADIVKRTLDGYQLTKRGHEIIKILRPFGDWSRKWAKEVFSFNENNSQ